MEKKVKSIAAIIGSGYDDFWRCKKRYRVVKGGKASKKSTTTALWIIGDERFCVDHAGRILIDLHARKNERFVVGARHFVYESAVADRGGDNAHVYAGFRGGGQRGDHLIIDDEIRGIDVNVVLGAVDKNGTVSPT